jgi:hypothetical protein
MNNASPWSRLLHITIMTPMREVALSRGDSYIVAWRALQ